MGLRERITAALNTEADERADSSEFALLITLDTIVGPQCADYLTERGIENLVDNTAGGKGGNATVTIRVRRASFEQAAVCLARFLKDDYDIEALDVAPTVDIVDTSSQHLVSIARDLDDSSMRAPSLLPGWTVGHVLSHIALHGEGMVRCADDLRAGRLGVMYPGGVDARAIAIDRGAGCSAVEIVEHLAASCAAFGKSWMPAPPEGRCISAIGLNEFSSDTVLLRRLRELEVHGSDTGIEALAYDRWSNAFVGADLTNQWESVVKRTDQPLHLVDELGGVWRTDSADPLAPSESEPFETTRRDLLAWLLDRRTETALPRLTPWGDQSRWGR
jgi:maleylpyruvate isomerase